MLRTGFLESLGVAKLQQSESVPKTMQPKFDSIVAITDAFAQEYLNAEYAQLIRYATAALCRKRPSPLVSGREHTWACGITHAIGFANFLFDPSQKPHISAGDLYRAFGVSMSTGQAKSKAVRETLRITQFDPNWCLPSLVEDNPLIWIVSVNGCPMDIRLLPRTFQEMAYQQGIIPHIPGEKIDPEAKEGVQSAKQTQSVEHPRSTQPTRQAKPMTPAKPTKTAKTAKQTKAAKSSPRSSPPDPIDDRPNDLTTMPPTNALYTLDVFIIDGPVTEEFVEENPEISRRIEIKGSQTLADLHKILFKAFDREEEHLYEFQVGGQGPNDPPAQRYGLPQPAGRRRTKAKPVQDATSTPIASVGLSVDDAFGYWFDFGDDWWHQINVITISEPEANIQYPRITHRVGASPPQYADFG
ncbi:plasmid pRiA4b ORF-3 family protein [Alkalinema pantanalense CENA528]|uniref:plasmid pRiA4b ORF-3 family protein n=1 Tax=Alkalinema pantanalense TaxID=1620705 RepID=UPI003D6DC655